MAARKVKKYWTPTLLLPIIDQPWNISEEVKRNHELNTKISEAGLIDEHPLRERNISPFKQPNDWTLMQSQ